MNNRNDGKAKNKLKTAKQMERHLKGMANHYRIEILLLIEKQPKMTVEDVADCLNANIKTIGEHVRRLALAGLVDRKRLGHYSETELSPYGRSFVRFLKVFQRM